MINDNILLLESECCYHFYLPIGNHADSYMYEVGSVKEGYINTAIHIKLNMQIYALLTMKCQWTNCPTLLPRYSRFFCGFFSNTKRAYNKQRMCCDGDTMAIMSDHWSTA